MKPKGSSAPTHTKSRYDPLGKHLDGLNSNATSMGFREIEDLVGPMPNSARTYREWWANDWYHSHSRWMYVGWRVESVNFQDEIVSFRRISGGNVEPDSVLADVRIPIERISEYAGRYDYHLEAAIEGIVADVRAQGHLTKSQLLLVGDWKSTRIRSSIAKNSEEDVLSATKLAFETRCVKLAAHIPQMLSGVGLPVASTLLHWFHADPFPIVDFRALWSLGIESPSSYSLSFWNEYVSFARKVSERCSVDMRTLDRALWQYSAEHQPKATETKG